MCTTLSIQSPLFLPRNYKYEDKATGGGFFGVKILNIDIKNLIQ